MLDVLLLSLQSFPPYFFPFSFVFCIINVFIITDTQIYARYFEILQPCRQSRLFTFFFTIFSLLSREIKHFSRFTRRDMNGLSLSFN